MADIMGVDTGCVTTLRNQLTCILTWKDWAYENRSKKKHTRHIAIKHWLKHMDLQHFSIRSDFTGARNTACSRASEWRLVRAGKDPCRWQRRSSELETTVIQTNNPNTPHQFLISSIRINYEAEGNLCTLCLRLPTGLIKNWMLEN